MRTQCIGKLRPISMRAYAEGEHHTVVALQSKSQSVHAGQQAPTLLSQLLSLLLELFVGLLQFKLPSLKFASKLLRLLQKIFSLNRCLY